MFGCLLQPCGYSVDLRANIGREILDGFHAPSCRATEFLTDVKGLLFVRLLAEPFDQSYGTAEDDFTNFIQKLTFRQSARSRS